MAFDWFQEQEENKPGGLGGPQPLGQQAAVVTGNAPAQQEAGKTASGSFTNLNSYLDANKDQGFGQQVAGKLDNVVTGARTAQDTAEQQFKTAADQGSVDTDQGMLDQVRVKPQDVDVAGFAKMRDASYSGPNTLSDAPDIYSPAQAATAKAYQSSQQTKDAPGRKAFLDQQYGSGAGRFDYSPGQQKLDNLLIQQDPSSKEAFQSVWQKADEANNRFGTLSTALDQYASGKKASTAATRQAARGTVGIDDSGNWNNSGVTGDDLSSLDKYVAAQKAELAKERGQVEPSFDAKSISGLSPETLQRLGISSDQFGGFDLRPPIFRGSRFEKYYQPYQLDAGNLLGVNPRNYASNAADVDLNRSTLASPEAQARIAALSQLAGKENSFIAPGQAGSMYEKPLTTANGSGLAIDVGNKRTALQADLQKALAKYQGLQDSGGLVDVTAVQNEGNAIRAKYGLPPL